MRTVKSCGPDTPTLVSSRWKQFRRRRWQKSPAHRGEHEAAVKTIAQGRPGRSGEPVVTTLVYFVFYRTRGCGCIVRPAFPAPSAFEGRTKSKTRAKKHAARMRSYGEIGQ